MTNKTDITNFKHGDEGTHRCCQEMLDKYGGKTKCCECTGHACKQTDTTKQGMEQRFRSRFHDNEVDGFVDNTTDEILDFIKMEISLAHAEWEKKEKRLGFDGN